ncbi:TetR/AcrR family transcriptional regulator [Streptomyces sp. NPDC049954]|uniref:TetR/AcrR family transcriptional regulator n=1 Tax=Streptomyces sp. NPDC049954 TaxID=3155779 RepID=UPI00342E9E33
MSPRPYRGGQRQAAAEQTRAKILDAARELLTAASGPGALSMEAAARKAGVARMTVYYQFESKTGLLEALFDDLAQRGGMSGMPKVFTLATGSQALRGLIRTLVHFYASDRLALRRLRGLAMVDPELEAALIARGERRRGGLGVILGRLVSERASGDTEGVVADLVGPLFMLTSFETYDALADSDGDPAPVVLRIEELAGLLLDRRLPTGVSDWPDVPAGRTEPTAPTGTTPAEPSGPAGPGES